MAKKGGTKRMRTTAPTEPSTAGTKHDESPREVFAVRLSKRDADRFATILFRRDRRGDKPSTAQGAIEEAVLAWIDDHSDELA